MKYKNSFFRIEIKDNGTYLYIFPALRDGKKLDIKEIANYIDDVGCYGYYVEGLKIAFNNMVDKPLRIKLSDSKINPYDERVQVIIAPDKMVAYMRFYPPTTGGKLLTKKDILTKLESEQIVHGISEKIIDVFMTARQYCLNIPVAKGKPLVIAKDTEIEYFFNTKPLSKPKVLEDGSVNFHDLNLFSTVKNGDILAKLTPHDFGEPGITIFGETIHQNKPKIKKLKFGRNIQISEDKSTLISEVDGNVTFMNDTVFVSDTYNVAADVDTSTGDIDYEGSVMIQGTVRTGFTVKAKGNIQVNGVVEGATLIAGGNIVIKRGVQGMGKGYLRAEGDICAQFFESANVSVDGDVIAGSIMHSNIASGGKVVVSGRKGFIVGGEIVCKSYVEVNSIGNKMETQTIIKVGVNPQLYEEIKKLTSEVTEQTILIEEISSYLNVYKEKIRKGIKLSPENVKQVKEHNSKLDELKEEYSTKTNRIKEIKAEIDKGKAGRVTVLGNSYRGVTIYIANLIYIVKDKDVRSVYKIIEGEIRPSVM